jgi:hypothetical protein
MGILRILGISKSPKQFCLDLGKNLYHTHSAEFENYYEEYLEDIGCFKDFNWDVIGDYEFKRLNPFNVLFAYGAHYEHLLYLDWRGEENDGEVIKFIEMTFPKQDFEWLSTLEFLKKSNVQDKRDGDYILDLFKTIDKDLNKSNYGLLFFNTDADGYYLIPTRIDILNTALKLMRGSFSKAENLRT